MVNDEFTKYLKAYPPDHFLIKEGSENQDFFCLLEGSVCIWKGNPEEKEKLIKVAEIDEKGTYFGEMSYILEESRTASIISKNKVKVLQFPGEMLEPLMLKQPKLALHICKTLAQHLKGSTTKTEEVSQNIGTLRNDVATSHLEAKKSYQTIFMLLSAIQTQFQNPLLKSVIELMAGNKLLQGGKKQKFDRLVLEGLPEQLVDLALKLFSAEEEE